METVIPNRLALLGHPQRLALFRLLMRRYPDQVPATELAQALGIKPNTLSTYVNALRQAGLISQQRRGTSLRYAIDMDAARETMDYLFQDCCRGRPDICAPLNTHTATESGAGQEKMLNVLFVCTGNSARSIFAETILREQGKDRFGVYSAGTKPRDKINPIALEVLRQKGHDTSALSSKHISVYQDDNAPTFDFVFTVCDQAANEECPTWAGQPVNTHWGLPDPAQAQGSIAEKTLAFQQAYGALHNRISAFVALPFASLDRIALQKAVDHIATTNKGSDS